MIRPGKISSIKLAQATYRKTAGIGLQHAWANAKHIHQTIGHLRDNLLGDASRRSIDAIVISAGPSLHLRHVAERILDSAFSGFVVATDGALGYCLRNGLVPDFVVSVDPHPHRIVRWFGDTHLEDRPEDDYFRRQDLDPHWLVNEKKRNQELISLVNQVGPRVPAVLSTSVAPSVTERVLEAGMPIYWWNPIYDDYNAHKSITRRIHRLTGAPCLVTGGNCGTAAWVFAGTVLGAKNVAVTGMDLSYAPKTPLGVTQYYGQLKKIFGSKVGDAYIHLRNPYLKQTWFTDPTYWWYRQCFLSLAQKAVFKTYNCTEGGILFGRGVRWTTLAQFLNQVKNG